MLIDMFGTYMLTVLLSVTLEEFMLHPIYSHYQVVC